MITAMLPAPDRTIDVNGVTIAVDDRGATNTAATPLVLIHGFTGGRVDFADVIDPLGEDRRVVAWDHRGHADSTNTGDPASYSFDQLAADAAAVVDALGLDDFHLLGHSMGGIVSMKYTLSHLDRVRSLILMDTGAEPMTVIPRDWLDGIVSMGRDKGMSAVADLMAGFLEKQDGLPADSKDRIIERLRYKNAHMDVEAFAALGNELRTFDSLLDGLANDVTCPVTVLVGENDVGLRPAADKLAEAIKASELVVIPDAAHSPQEEQPAAWLAAVRAHLDRAER